MVLPPLTITIEWLTGAGFAEVLVRDRGVLAHHARRHIAARLRFGTKPKGRVWAARGALGRQASLPSGETRKNCSQRCRIASKQGRGISWRVAHTTSSLLEAA